MATRSASEVAVRVANPQVSTSVVQGSSSQLSSDASYLSQEWFEDRPTIEAPSGQANATVFMATGTGTYVHDAVFTDGETAYMVVTALDDTRTSPHVFDLTADAAPLIQSMSVSNAGGPVVVSWTATSGPSDALVMTFSWLDSDEARRYWSFTGPFPESSTTMPALPDDATGTPAIDGFIAPAAATYQLHDVSIIEMDFVDGYDAFLRINGFSTPSVDLLYSAERAHGTYWESHLD